MPASWSETLETRYQSQTQDETRRACRVLVLLAVLLFPAFSILDYFTQSSHFAELSAIRFATSFVFALLFPFVLRESAPRRPTLYALAILALATISITGMCLILTGYESRYYAGINLVLLAAGLTLPWNGRKMAWTSAVITVIYAAAVLGASRLEIARPDLLINNFCFLIATGIIVAIHAHYRDRNRREAFARLVSIESARDFLKKELESGQTSLENLVSEIARSRKELQEMRDQAQRALTLRDEFISIASHELKTPVTAMKLHVQLARRTIRQNPGEFPDSYRKLVELYESQLGRLYSLIEGIFDCSAARAGQLELSPEPMDLALAVRDAVDELSGALRDARIPVNLRLHGPVSGHWDRMRIGQVMTNLVTNAIKYGEGKPIDISLNEVEGRAIVTVRDHGMGIPREKHELIFDQFERAVSSQQISGLGLGLYISKKIIEAHQGSISVESEPGAGALFTVMLPAG